MIQNIEGQNSNVSIDMSNDINISSNELNPPPPNNCKKTNKYKLKKFRNNYECLSTPDGFKIGKWQKDEHVLFLKACEKYGNNWGMVKTRSAAQIRSHAQKYIIKLCKKYRIKIKSKKFKKKSPRHLDYVNRQKCPKAENSNGIGSLEKKLLDTFNYYNREYKPFSIEKIHRGHKSEFCDKLIQNKLVITKLKNQVFLIKKFPKKLLNNNSNHSYERIDTHDVDLNNNLYFSQICERKKNLSQDISIFNEQLQSFYLYNDYFNKNFLGMGRNLNFISPEKELLSFIENFPRSTGVQIEKKTNILDNNLIFEELIKSTHKFIEELNSSLFLMSDNPYEMVNSFTNTLIKNEAKLNDLITMKNQNKKNI